MPPGVKALYDVDNFDRLSACSYSMTKGGAELRARGTDILYHSVDTRQCPDTTSIDQHGGSGWSQSQLHPCGTFIVPPSEEASDQAEENISQSRRYPSHSNLFRPYPATEAPGNLPRKIGSAQFVRFRISVSLLSVPSSIRKVNLDKMTCMYIAIS